MAISRRSALRGFGIASGALVAAFTGVFPETKLADGAMVAIADPRETGKERRVRSTLLHGTALDDQIRRSVNDTDGKLVVEHLSANGLMFDLSSATALQAVWDDDGSILGSLLTLEAHDRHGSTTARFIRHIAGTTVRTGYAIWKDARPGSIDVFETVNGRIDRSAHIEQQSNGSLAVELSDGRRIDIPSTQPSFVPGHKLGLARPMADTCSQICNTVVGLVCALSCGIVFFAICGLIGIDSLGTAAFACFLIATTFCSFGCNWVQQTSCSWLCSG